MKNLTLVTISLFLSLAVFSQEKVNVTVCEKSATSINIAHLIDCKLLSVDNSSYKVYEFTIGFKSGDDYIEVKMTDNVISGKIIDLINKVNPSMIYIEQIVLINKKGEKLNVEPFKVKK